MKETTTESKVKTESVEHSEASGSKTEQQPVLSISKIKRDFKISGHIGDISQKDRLSFLSLSHQIEHGLRNDYKEDEIKEAVIKAINCFKFEELFRGKVGFDACKNEANLAFSLSRENSNRTIPPA